MPENENVDPERKPESEVLKEEAEARAKADAMEEARKQVADDQKKAVKVFRSR